MDSTIRPFVVSYLYYINGLEFPAQSTVDAANMDEAEAIIRARWTDNRGVAPYIGAVWTADDYRPLVHKC